MYKLRLKELRKAAGFKTQRAFAEHISMKERRYAALERGEIALDIEGACSFCEELGCDPNDLCNWYEDHPRVAGAASLPSDPRRAAMDEAFNSTNDEGRDAAATVVTGMAAAYPQKDGQPDLVEEEAHGKLTA